MNRIRKYRAWDKIVGKMLDVLAINPMSQTIYVSHYQRHGNHGEDILLSYDSVSLIEFTGLYDINGKEVYETDIIKFDEDYRHQNYRGNIGIITWYKNRACFFIDVKYSGYSQSYIYDLTDLHSNTRIIGNIFETPELLKV